MSKPTDALRQIAANLAIFDFTLTPEEMAAIDAIDTGQRLAVDPDLEGLAANPPCG